MVTPPPKKPRTPEQQKRFEEVSERQQLLQEKGVPAPASGTFGVPPKKPK